MSAGTANSAFGAFTLFSAVSCNFNTAVGAGALLNNNTDGNTAVGAATLLNNTTGQGNTAVGAAALLQNIGGSEGDGSLNTAVGLQALTSNTTGGFNTAVGGGTLEGPAGKPPLGSNTTGTSNTAVGSATSDPGALGSNTTGDTNTAIGAAALNMNTTGSFNIAVGFNAGSALTTGSGNIDIGNNGNENEESTIHIGTAQTATFIAGISGTAVVGDPVVVDANGQLGTATSSARFKKDIKPMDKMSQSILGLKPVSFQYKSDSRGTPQFGLIAEEVAQVNPDLVVRDRSGKIYSVRYEAVNAMLLNEFLKEHRTVQEQQKQIDALTAGLQKVSAQLEMSKPAPQTALNNH
jgi:hypothetical protein